MKKLKLKGFKLRKPNINPFVRMSLGLVCLTLCMVLVGDMVLGLTSDERRALLDQRKKICETLAVQFSELAEAGEVDTIRKSMQSLVSGNADVMSTALVDIKGKTLAFAGDHATHWEPPGGESSTPTHAQVPIFSGDKKWGTVEVSFAKTELDFSGLMEDPLVQFLAFLAIAGFAAYMFFMKKTLKNLDPKAVIPDRVRSALDLLAEGVVMVDRKGDIVLANLAFASKAEKDVNALLGQSLSKMTWHSNDVKKKRVKDKNLPWARAMKEGGNQTDVLLSLTTNKDEKRHFSINSSPIMDDKENMRGAMVTFNDETALQQANAVLVDMMDKLKSSQEQAKLQNAELQRLATQDPLTSCLNRRSFFEQADLAWAKAVAEGEPLACIMTDIDRFKSINDKFGHMVGDQVIEAVAKLLVSNFRKTDLICRYGGEEFCILMPGAELDQAVKVAEQARATIAKSVSEQLKTKEPLQVTSSFGVSSLKHGAKDVAGVINQADKALYLAKQSGRDKVSRWDQV
ncbi:MAG: diguanylate cyclase, partial [Gammaproteobacteria bacterium]|nr:diguanylate cyclase [Gammaproteobacteria bacterium]NIO66145.1 diguanylate cyclase [Gammaproteobacteria bacterium]NIP65119.1 diguanylate cyclase [Gammaproteobacteria bacterium]NIQ27268.1 diguanylate cyclase [Gammaproteobacteria bacterium]NIR20411.1 diguanylate cyclase [Gammaproteobacteria bacterium]